MFGPERIETLIAELNKYAELTDDAYARHTMADVYRWIYHSNRGTYRPVTELSATAARRFPRMAEDLRKIAEEEVVAAVCPSPSLHFSPSDDSLNTKVLTLSDCGYCEGKVVVRL